MLPRWSRSLYGRIGIGFVVFVAVILAVQVVFLAWMADRAVGTLPGRSPSRFAEILAADVSSKLTRNRQADVKQLVRRKFARVSHPFYLLMTDGRFVSNGAEPDDLFLQFMRNELRRRILGRKPPEPLRPRVGRASILVDGKVVGLAAVPPKGPLIAAIGRFAPRLAISSLIVLMAGAVLAAVLIVRSPHRRLTALQEATRRVATGDLSVRAPEDGQDEIAVLARDFNAMAVELGVRADQLQAADHARRQLLADMCHELSTPLTAILGYVEVLSIRGVSLDAITRKRYLSIIDQEAHRLQRRIDDLLDLARLEAGGGILTIRPISVPQLFHDVVATHERECARKQITLTASTEPGAETVLGDPERLEQVLQNLAANAIRHTPPDGRIEVRAATRGTVVHMTVMDTGEGIAPEHLSRVFDRFYKVNSVHAGRSGGSGLGLSIAKAITERHGGTIAVSSRAGQTVFDVTLPLPDQKDLAAEAPKPLTTPAAVSTASEPRTWSHRPIAANG